MLNLKMKLTNGVCTSKVRLEGKTALITGANSGIGKETAQDFYKRGARVLMACRDLTKAQEAAQEIRNNCSGELYVGEIVPATVALDLSSLKSVRSYAKHILETEQRLDLLVNNAGVMCTPEGKTEDGFETQFAANHLGPFLLTLMLLPRMIASENARIVNVSSLVHSFAWKVNLEDLNYESRKYQAADAYNCSKLCNILFTKELARRLEAAGAAGVKVYALHPGMIRTELGRYLDQAYFRGLYFVWRMVHWFLKTPQQGAQTTIYCAVDEACARETGLYYSDCEVKEPSASAGNVEDAKKLWDVSVKLCGLDSYDPFAKEQEVKLDNNVEHVINSGV